MLLVSPPFRRDADEKLEVDAGHGARQHRKIVFVEEVVDGQFQLNVDRLERQAFFKRYIAHEVARQMTGEGVIVARHGEPFRIIGPLLQERP